MKSQLFKTAWTLTKQMKMAFSEALTKAWAAYKANAELTVRKTWNGVMLISYKKQVSNVISVFAGSLSEVIAKAQYSEPNNNDGAAAYYGVGAYNGD